MIKTSYNKAAGELKPEAYPQGYVEDFDDPRTTWEVFFIIRIIRLGRGTLPDSFPRFHPHCHFLQPAR